MSGDCAGKHFPRLLLNVASGICGDGAPGMNE
jgi:hypothetical protein